MRRYAMLIATSVAMFLSLNANAEARRHHGSHHSRHTNRVHVSAIPNRSVLSVIPEKSAFEEPQEALAYKDLNISAMLQGWHDAYNLVLTLGKYKPKVVEYKPIRPLGVAFSMLGVVLLGAGICYGIDRRMKREVT